MKRALIVTLVAFAAGVFSIGMSSSNAKELSIAERFGPNENLVEAVSGTYEFDVNHSAIGFKVLHMGLVYVPGYFKEFSGSINYNAEDVTKSGVEFTAKTESVDTRVQARDNHLKTADFFDVQKYPEMTFKSTKVSGTGDSLMVTGDLTLRGVTKSITIPVKIAGFKDGRGGKVMGATSQTAIKRSDYGVSYGLGGAVADEVNIELNIEAGIKKEAK